MRQQLEKTATRQGGCFCKEKRCLQVLLVGLDHFLDHLSADGTGLAAGQVTVVAVFKVHADILRCVFTSKI